MKEINFRDIPYNLAFVKSNGHEYANCNIESCYACKFFQCLAWSDDPDADQSEYEQGNCHNPEIENSLDLGCSNESVCDLFEKSEF